MKMNGAMQNLRTKNEKKKNQQNPNTVGSTMCSTEAFH